MDMNHIRKMDVLVGIKAEQSLRDAVRLLVDESDTDLELTPVGRKDWVAGQRVGSTVVQGELEEIFRAVHKKLLALGSEQRIRSESIRLYVVQEPVPVFKDPEQDAAETPEVEPQETASEPAPSGPSTCPICNRTVHSYNLHYNTDGKVVGCFMCGGNAGIF